MVKNFILMYYFIVLGISTDHPDYDSKCVFGVAVGKGVVMGA